LALTLINNEFLTWHSDLLYYSTCVTCGFKRNSYWCGLGPMCFVIVEACWYLPYAFQGNNMIVLIYFAPRHIHCSNLSLQSRVLHCREKIGREGAASKVLSEAQQTGALDHYPFVDD
jgi:hypothetical protein